MTRSQDGTTGPLPSPREEQNLPLHQGIEDRVRDTGGHCGESTAEMIHRQRLEDRVSRREQIAEAIYQGAFADVWMRVTWANLREEVKAPIYAAADLVMALPHTVRAEPVAWRRIQIGVPAEPFAWTLFHDNHGEVAHYRATGRYIVEPLGPLPQDPDPLIGELVGALEAIKTAASEWDGPIMRAWDASRAELLDGDMGSGPRDRMESAISACFYEPADKALDKARLYQGEG